MSITIKNPAQDALWLQALLKGLSEESDRQLARHQNEFAGLVQQINTISDADTLGNMEHNVNRFSTKMKNLGYDEYNLDNFMDTKRHVFNEAKRAFDIGLQIAKDWELNPLVDPDGDGKRESKWMEVDNASFEEVTKKINELGAHISNITTAVTDKNYGGYFHKAKKGDERFNQTVVLNSLQKELGVWMNKDTILDNNKDMFTIDKNEDGVPDIQATAFYEQLREKMLTGDVEGFSQWFDANITDIGKKYQRNENMYINLKEVYDQIDPKAYKFRDGKLELKGGDDISQTYVMNLLDSADISPYKTLNAGQYMTLTNRLDQAIVNLKKYNGQYQLLTKKPFDDNPIFIHDKFYGMGNEDIPAMGGQSLTDKQYKDNETYIRKMVQGALK